MSEVNNSGFHVFLKSEQDRQTVLKDSSSYERYIILSNEALQVENRALLKENQMLETQVEELTDECSRNEKGIAHTKGFLHNLVIMQRLTDEKSQNFVDIEKKTRKVVNDYQYKALRHFRFLQFGLIALVSIFWEYQVFTIEQQILVCTLLGMYTAFHHSTIHHIVLPNVKEELEKLKEIQKELDELHKSNDWLNEYVDLL